MPDLEAEILKGIQSGDPVEMTAEDWKAMREEVVRRHAAQHGKVAP